MHKIKDAVQIAGLGSGSEWELLVVTNLWACFLSVQNRTATSILLTSGLWESQEETVEHTLENVKISSVTGTSLAGQWLRLCIPVQRVQVWALVEKLRFHMPRGQNTQNIKQKHYEQIQ